MPTALGGTAQRIAGDLKNPIVHGLASVIRKKAVKPLFAGGDACMHIGLVL